MIEYCMFLLLIAICVYMIVFYFNTKQYLFPITNSSSSSLSSSSLFSIMEGLETKKDTKTDASLSQNGFAQSGEGAGSPQFSQTIANTISSYDTRLNIPTYGNQYKEIIQSLRDLYERKALSAILQPIKTSNAKSIQDLLPHLELYLCTQNLNSLDNLEEFVKTNSSLPNRLF